MIECHQNVLQKHLGNNFLTSECITDRHCLNEGKTTKDEIIKGTKKMFSLHLHWSTLFFIDQNVLYEFVLRHE